MALVTSPYGIMQYREMDAQVAKVATIFATNALASISFVAIPTGYNFIELLEIFAGYSVAATVGNLTVGPQVISITDIADKPAQLQTQLYAVLPTVSLAAGGAGVIGFIAAFYRFVG